MKIPKQISILDQTYKIHFKDDFSHVSNYLGKIIYDENVIYLQTPDRFNTKNKIQSVFWHEVVHGVLAALNRDDLNNDEAFVDLVAACVNQVIISGEI